MKKKIFGGIVMLAFLAILGVNVSLKMQKNIFTNLTLENIGALAQDENGAGAKLYNCKLTVECEDIFYYCSVPGYMDVKYTYVRKETICNGLGSLACAPDYDYKFIGSEPIGCTH